MATRARQRVKALAWFGVAFALLGSPLMASAATAVESQPSADLDGKSIELKQVGSYFCEDFTYPQIHCFASAGTLESRVASTLAATSADYVTIYDFGTFAGSYMYVSQDYVALATIGWNDRISSFIARNGEIGHFFTDWFYGGNPYVLCCNQQVSSLGSFDNVFSSMHHG